MSEGRGDPFGSEEELNGPRVGGMLSGSTVEEIHLG